MVRKTCLVSVLTWYIECLVDTILGNRSNISSEESWIFLVATSVSKYFRFSTSIECSRWKISCGFNWFRGQNKEVVTLAATANCRKSTTNATKALYGVLKSAVGYNPNFISENLEVMSQWPQYHSPFLAVQFPHSACMYQSSFPLIWKLDGHYHLDLDKSQLSKWKGEIRQQFAAHIYWSHSSWLHEKLQLVGDISSEVFSLVSSPLPIASLVLFQRALPRSCPQSSRPLAQVDRLLSIDLSRGKEAYPAVAQVMTVPLRPGIWPLLCPGHRASPLPR